MAKERILVVEDDEDILELLRYNLAKEGYQVATAKTGEDGLKEAVASPPDLICLDLMLPSIDGLEVCSRLKQDHRTQAVSVIMVTAKGEEPDIVTSGLDTVGVRMPAHPMTMELLRRLDFPLAAPSANPFGYVSPTTAQHVADQLGSRIPYILDGGPCTVGVESTIIGWERGVPVLYRPGGLPLEAIEEVVGSVNPQVRHVLPVAPGMIESHYAPRKPLRMGDVRALCAEEQGRRIGVLAFRDRFAVARCATLSPAGDVNEAARNLFAAMRGLDASDVDVIIAEVFPEQGLGKAINDRLRRAAAKR